MTASIARATTAERLAAGVSEAIMAGRLAPGAPLREEELARTYRASRHVVREALRLVVGSGLATYEAYKGARVSHISVEDVQDIYRTRRIFEVRSLLQVETGGSTRLAQLHGAFSAAVAAERWADAFEADHAFHREIVSWSGSKRMMRWHAELFQALSRAHLVRAEFQAEGFRASVGQHAQVVVALAAGDSEAAAAALTDHLGFSESLLTGPART